MTNSVPHKKRLNDIQTTTPTRITVHNYFKVYHQRAIEVILHNHFKHKNVSGEWFNLDNNDMDEIEDIVNKHNEIHEKYESLYYRLPVMVSFKNYNIEIESTLKLSNNYCCEIRIYKEGKVGKHRLCYVECKVNDLFKYMLKIKKMINDNTLNMVLLSKRTNKDAKSIHIKDI